MSKIWITSLAKNHENVQKMVELAKVYGVEAYGHFWVDDLKNMAWAGAVEALIDPAHELWMILANDEDWAKPSVRYGLSLLSLAVGQARGKEIPKIIAQQGEAISEPGLPTLLKSAEIFDLDSPFLGAQIVKKMKAAQPSTREYRFYPHTISCGGGQWFEVGPASNSWKGVMFGVNGATIDAHGVGPAGKVPFKAVLEYPIKDMKVALGDTEYVAWAVKNELSTESSYYVRVQGEPQSVLFGPLVEDDAGEAYVMKLA